MKRLLSRLFSRSSAPHSRLMSPAKPSREVGCGIEPLESRIAPAAVAVLNNGTLLIQGDPDGILEIEQSVEVVGAQTIVTTLVTDNSAPLAGNSSFEGVKNIVVKLDRSATDENSVEMRLARLPGSVEVLSPKAATTNVQIQGLASVDDLPQIGKSVLLKGGAGVESLVISGIDIGGGLVFPAGKGTASAVIGGDVSLGSSVSLLGTNYVHLGSGAQIDGNLLITQKTSATESFVLGAGARITGNVVLFAGSGSTSINAYSEVGGNVAVYAGEGPNVFNVSLVAKSLRYIGGSGIDSVSLLRSEIAGSATFILSGGNNQVAFNLGPFDLLGDFSVGKNLSIGGGRENDLLRLDSTTNEVAVGKKTVISLSKGDNIVVWNGSSTGTSINIAGGSGVDIFNVFGLDAPTAALNVDLGGGNDRLLVSATFLKASLNGSSGNDELVTGSTLPAGAKLKGFEVGV